MMREYLHGYGGRLGPFVKGMRVETTHLGRTTRKTIKKVTDRMAKQTRFHCEEYGSMVTVQEYFRRSMSHF